MDFKKSFKTNLTNITKANFEDAALALFNYQNKNNLIYNLYVNQIKVKPEKVKSIFDIPFLPIEFFKNHEIKTGKFVEEEIFESSGTTGVLRSMHFVEDSKFYQSISRIIFEDRYGDIKNYTFLALLPSYLERENSSLVFMVDYFIKNSTSQLSGFYLNNYDELIERIKILKQKNHPTIIIGVTYALLELAEQYDLDLGEIIVMETGGMKGRRKEITQYEVHDFLKSKFAIPEVHTEYGMTELLSQAYSKNSGILEGPNWFKVLIRDINDPFDVRSMRKTGGVNIIDLANIHSCAFIETKDIGEIVEGSKFRILGRMDNSEVRGCNLLIQ